ncbi:MAG: hypothetical protein MJ252_27430 [archaeon]|nr:hypothetical protein [archaeon]
MEIFLTYMRNAKKPFFYLSKLNLFIFLRVLDRVRPGCVDWKVVDEKTKNPFKKGVNCNEAINAAKKNGYHIVGIGGGDVRNGNKKYILAIVWQIMRDHTLQIIGGKSEEELVTWGNALMPEDSLKIKDLKDKSLSTGLWFINICKAIDARAINWNIVVKEPQSDEDKEKNAKYALSVARKLEALVFCVWEDIKEVKSGMLLTLLASLYEVYSKKQ